MTTETDMAQDIDTCPYCQHDRHDGVYCSGWSHEEGVDDERMYPCACSYPDAGNYSEVPDRVEVMTLIGHIGAKAVNVYVQRMTDGSVEVHVGTSASGIVDVPLNGELRIYVDEERVT